MKNTINYSSGNKTLYEQREKLIKLNNDIIYGVYNKVSNENGQIKLKVVEDVLTCYPNQLEKIKGLEKNQDIMIIDINALRKGSFEILSGKQPDYTSRGFTLNGSFKTDLDDGHTFCVNRNLTLLSSGVIELINAKKADGTYRTHSYTNLRDGGATDVLQRTGVAGRNSSNNLNEEIEREYTEESPFLSQINGVWSLATPQRENKIKALKDLKISLEYFLKNKYNLDRNNPEEISFIKMFERSFKGLKYEELGDVLKDILNNIDSRVVYFKNRKLDSYPGLEKNIKNLSILDDKGHTLSSGKYFIYQDEANNTIEYRSLREIELLEGFSPRQRLFLESQNQYVKIHRLENLSKDKLVPTMTYFADRVKSII